MDKVVEIAGPISGPLAVAALIAALLVYVVGRRLSESREVIRVLRTGLDRDPTPAQLNEAMALWPEAQQFPGTHQVVELRKLARDAESKRAQSYEVAKSGMRFFLAVAFLSAAIFLTCLLWNRFAPKKTAELLQDRAVARQG